MPQYEELQLCKDPIVLGKWIQEAKLQAVIAKRSGDIITMQHAYGLFKRLEELNNNLSSKPEKVTSISSSKVGEKMIPLKEVYSKLLQQAEECKKSVSLYIKNGNKSEAALFLRRQKALEADAVALRSASLANQKIVAVQHMLVLLPSNEDTFEDISDNELLVTISKWKDLKKAQKSIQPNEALFFKTFLDWPSDAEEADKLKISSLFSFPTDPNIRIVYSTIRRDPKTIKYFEHHKLKLELYRQEKGLFRTKKQLLASSQIRLQPLLQKNFLVDSIELYDESKKSIGLSVDVSLKIKKPLQKTSSSEGKNQLNGSFLKEVNRQRYSSSKNLFIPRIP